MLPFWGEGVASGQSSKAFHQCFMHSNYSSFVHFKISALKQLHHQEYVLSIAVWDMICEKLDHFNGNNGGGGGKLRIIIVDPLLMLILMCSL